MSAQTLWIQARRPVSLLLLTLMTGWCCRAGSILAHDYRLKALCLYNFAKYIEWPAESSLSNPATPIVIAVLGKDPIVAALEEAVRDRTAQNRKVIVRRLGTLVGLHDVHILFVSSSDKQRVKSLFNLAAKTGVFTVSDMEGFTGAGGMAGFIRKERGIDFEINTTAVRDAGIRIRSQLLKLARTPASKSRGQAAQ
jgi:hypothetical protein